MGRERSRKAEHHSKSGEAHEPFRLDFSEAGDSEVSFTAEENSSITVYELHRSNSAVKLSFDIGKNASVKLVQLLNPTEKLRHETFANCSKGGKFQIMTIMTGDGNIYSDNRTELEGDSSSINVEVAYLGKNSQTIDYNIAVNHWGKDTHSGINAAGALMDSAKRCSEELSTSRQALPIQRAARTRQSSCWATMW